MSLKFLKVFIVSLFILLISTFIFAQETPTSADVMRERISKAKAYLVVKNYNAAIYELENIKRETKDSTVNRVLNVLLMHSYLEQGDYKKAQTFLKTLFNSKKPNAAMDYFAVAGQVISGAKSQLERYKSLGLSVSDRNLPIQASTDVENMRNTLELVVKQSSGLSKNKQFTANALALLEESSVARASLAKDAYDEKRWKDQISDAREQMVGSRSVIINAVDSKPIVEKTSTKAPSSKTIALSDLKDQKTQPEVKPENTIENAKVNDNIFELRDVPNTPKPAPTNVAKKEEPKIEEKPETPKEKVADKKEENTAPENKEKETVKKDEVAKTDKKPKEKPTRPRITPEKKTEKKTADKKEEADKPKKETKIPEKNVAENNEKKEESAGPLTVGSLISYATQRVNPVYPRTARSMRLTGVVKVKVVVDEDGKVAKVEDMEGPAMLKRAARNAIRKWKFKPFKRDGQPVKATGFVNFNFSL